MSSPTGNAKDTFFTINRNYNRVYPGWCCDMDQCAICQKEFEDVDETCFILCAITCGGV